jgi:hypothetical protein
MTKEQDITLRIQQILFEIEDPSRRLAVMERLSKKMRQANGAEISKEVKSFANKLLRETKNGD